MARAVRALAGGGAQLLSIGKEAANRALGAPGFVANLGGVERRKRLRVYAVVLSEPGKDGAEARPLATEKRVRDELLVVDEIFKRQANTEVLFAEWPRIRTIERPAPDYVLHVECGSGSWTQDLGEPGVYFRRELASLRKELAATTRAVTGYGEPIAVFVVRDVLGKGGCSLGPLSDYVTVDRANGRLIAHELGHSCGLWHSEAAGNLMLPAADSETMTRAQRAIFRNSRHVTYL